MHPGEVIKELYIKESGMSLKAVAQVLGYFSMLHNYLIT